MSTTILTSGLVYASVVIWYKVSHLPVLLVISRDPAGKERDDFFFTTDLKLTPAEVVGGFAGRWSIEDTFKNTKQSLDNEAFASRHVFVSAHSFTKSCKSGARIQIQTTVSTGSYKDSVRTGSQQTNLSQLRSHRRRSRR